MQTFYMMVGLPASGKSTKAEKIKRHQLHFGSEIVIHSSDAIREELLGDVQDQSQQSKVFEVLHQRIFDDLLAGKSVIYDATNVSYKRRAAFLNDLKSLRLPKLNKVCVFMVTPYEDCIKNNESRERRVPVEVIDRMYRNIDVPMMAEGWDEIDIRYCTAFVPRIIDNKLRELGAIEQDNPHHTLTIGQHCLAAWGAMLDMYPEAPRYLLRAALLHDIGKEKTKAFVNSKGEPSEIAHFYNHERVGAYDSFLYTGDMSAADALHVALLIRWHMAPFVISHSEHPDKTEQKFRRLLGEDVWNEIKILHECDLRAH